MYAHGKGVAQNHAEATKLYQLAAEQGDVEAQFVLGTKYDFGDGTIQNFVEAFKWYQMAADQGHTKAQFNLGLMYSTGDGVTQNCEKSLKWLQRAAEQGDVNAQAIVLQRKAETRPAETRPAEPITKLCAACSIAKPLGSFTNSQLKKKSQRRCIPCEKQGEVCS